MDWNNQIPEWENQGTEPSEDLKSKGFEAGYKPAAGIFNWFWSLVSKAIKEIQTKFGSHAESKSNPHGVTKEQVGLDKVDNTSDASKHVAFASEAAVGRKVENDLVLRINGGKSEGMDLFTYNGATGKSINLTPEKLGASPDDHNHTLAEIPETDDRKVTRFAVATTEDGITYTATIDGVTELYNGMEIMIIPSKNNSKNPTLNINGLGAVKIYRPLIFSTFTANAIEENHIRANTPCRLKYHQTYVTGGIWLLADSPKTSVNDLYGTVPVDKGGTGVKSLEELGELIGSLGCYVNIATGSYDGTGTSGSSSPTSITLDFVPKMVIVYLEGQVNVQSYDMRTLTWIGQSNDYMSSGGYKRVFTLSGTKLSWYCVEGYGAEQIHDYQLNRPAFTYHYVAFA